MRRLLATLTLGIGLAAAGPAAAEDIAELRSALAGLQRDDARLLSIGWRLARANAGFCADPQPTVGLLPLDARSFKQPGEVRAALGLSGEFAVQAVAAGSPAAEAAMNPGDELVAIDGVALDKLPDVRPGSYSRLAALQTKIEETLGGKGALDLQFKAPGGATRHVSLKGLSACRSRFELLTGGNEASADGQRVTISRRFLSLAHSDDEAAFFVGHELAHNILRHRAWLDKVGRSSANVRASERAADRLALWLMANAGYDLARAPDFMQRWGKRQANLLFHSSTHDHWKARLILMQTELPKIAAARAAHPGAPLDWRPLFPR